ncbi:hypothetical protein SAMN04488012_108102 [Palleronia salina]|uniref:Lipoprotein-attachment site-containing protein n=1 Tax=Palleronia salina TaxID=313368 RepID=A0A1M6ITP5_9RHOB|nr:hypothetical protein [Palleronia salina]SHJ37729.1 hypothetical protein SAMN04488012_108102 [Palleronia salina]
MAYKILGLGALTALLACQPAPPGYGVDPQKLPAERVASPSDGFYHSDD